MLKVGDFVKTKAFLGNACFAKIVKIEDHDGYSCYVIESPEGELNCYGPELLTKKEAKELIIKLQKNIDFLKQI